MRGIAAQATVRGVDGTVGALDLVRIDWRQNSSKWSRETTTATKSTAAGARAGPATRYDAGEGELAGVFVSWEQPEHDDVLRGELSLH